MYFANKFSPYVSSLISEEDWLIEQKTYDPSQNLKYETLFCLANGYMGNRASYEEGGVRKTLPANYVHGVFDRSEAFQRELCNTPNWLCLRIYYCREPIGIEDTAEIIDFIRLLDMRRGMLFKRYVLRSIAYACGCAALCERNLGRCSPGRAGDRSRFIQSECKRNP